MALVGGAVRGIVGTNVVYAPPVEMGRRSARGYVMRGRYMFAKGLKHSLNAIRSYFARALRELVQKLAGN